MVVCVDTPYYDMGFGGLKVEDTLVVPKDGVDSFMLSGTGLKVV
jgi:Xaa-Pro aminopeptidase